MKMQATGIFLFTIILVLAACQNTQTPTPVSATATTAGSSATSDSTPCLNNSAYPAAGYPADCTVTSTQVGGYPAAGPPLEPVIIPEGEEWYAQVLPPGSGKATVTGIVMSESSGKPIVNVPVALAEVFYQGGNGAFVLDGAFSPHTVTDSEGRFAFVDVPAMDYVLVVGNPEVNDYKIIEEPSGKAQVWTAAADNILDMSVISVDLRIWK